MRCQLIRLFGLVGLILVLVSPGIALAHPLGNFTVNHYSRIEPAGGDIRVIYVLDMAEIPTFQELAKLDADGNGQVTDAERDRYAATRADEIRSNLHLTLDEIPTSLRVVSRSLSFPPGQGGLSTLRLEAVFNANLPPGADRAVSLAYRDDNDPARIGWREIVARPGAAGTTIQQATVPPDDRTDELRNYPTDMLTSPLDVREARLTFVPGAVGSGAGAVAGGLPQAVNRASEIGSDVYASLAAAETLTPLTIIIALGTALVLGAFHALSPGHGKTVVAAYLVGSRGTALHAVFLGATVTATHTIGVYALGFVTLYLSQFVLPERLYPVLEVVSGLLVVAIGGSLLFSRVRGVLAYRVAQHKATSRSGQDGPWQPTFAGRNARHTAEPLQTGPRQGEAAHDLAMEATSHSTSTTAIRPQDHGRVPDHNGHEHHHDHHRSHPHLHPEDDAERSGSPADPFTHTHGGSTHSHLPPGADGRPVTWRSLLALGVSGGLLPCPSALVVLLSAIALHRVAFGLLLIVAFSLGLAGVLVGIGLLLVYARQFLQRISLGGGLTPRLLPAISAALIMVAGIVIVLGALPQIL